MTCHRKRNISIHVATWIRQLRPTHWEVLQPSAWTTNRREASWSIVKHLSPPTTDFMAVAKEVNLLTKKKQHGHHTITSISGSTFQNHKFDVGSKALQCVPIFFSCVGTILFQPWVTLRILESCWACTVKLLCSPLNTSERDWEELNWMYFLGLLLTKCYKMWSADTNDTRTNIMVWAATWSRDIVVNYSLKYCCFHGCMLDVSKKSTDVYKAKPWRLFLSFCLSSLEVTHAVVT